MKMYRQGDVGIFPVTAIPSSAKQKPSGPVVLALGEVTGHSHRFEVGAAVLDYETEAAPGTSEVDRYIDVLEKSLLKHEEHREIELPPGKYRIVIQREYQPEGWSYVAD